MRTLILASLVLMAACAPRRASTASLDRCERPRTDGDPWLMPTTGLAGGYEFVVVSRGPSHINSRIVGVLWLWSARNTDTSPKTGQRAAPTDSTRVPYYGATDVNFSTMTTTGPRDEATLRARTDPVFPEILVTADHGVWQGKPWQELEMWDGSLMNFRDGTIGLDGPGFNMLIANGDSAGFRGTWGPAGIALTDTGYFCARRLR